MYVRLEGECYRKVTGSSFVSKCVLSFDFELTDLIRMKNWPSLVLLQPCLTGQTRLHDGPTTLARWVEAHSVSCSPLVREVDGHEEVVTWTEWAFWARVHLVRLTSCEWVPRTLVGHLHQVSI